MKLFLDTAKLDEIRRAAAWGVIDGVTTNPSLIARERAPIEDRIREICGIVDGDVSAAVVSKDWEEMTHEGRLLSRIHSNVVVKLPLTRDGIRACSILSKEGIRTNVTLCFTAAQALLAAKAGAYIVSPFVGRLDDIGAPGLDLVRDIAAIYKTAGFGTLILAASLRSPMKVTGAAKAGAHIATVTFPVLEALFEHPLTQKGLDQFLSDYASTFQETAVG